MTTRLDIQYQCHTFPPSTNMDFNIAAIINALTEKFDDMKDFIKTMSERITVLEEARQRQSEPESPQLLIGQRRRNLDLNRSIAAQPNHNQFD